MNKFFELLKKWNSISGEFYFDFQGNNWIAGAVKNPGAFRAQAEAAGKITQKGNIDVNWIKQMARNPPDRITGQRANLALTLRGLRK